MDKLIEKYLKAKDYYYNKTPIMSDVEFDQLEEQIKTNNPNHPALDIVGYSIKDADKIKHTVPMLSMEKAMKQKDLLKWLTKKELDSNNRNTRFVATNKLDGMSAELRYEKGVLKEALTRGDGVIGRNITAKVRHIVPNVISREETVAIRGELVMSKGNLDELNRTLEEPLSNPRNGVGGVINEDKIDPEKLKYVDFVAFESLNSREDGCRYYQEDLDSLQFYGFTIPHYRVITASCDAKAAISHFTLLREQDDILWDGIVFRVNDLFYGEQLGRTAKFWKRAIAYKFPAEMTTVTIKKIEWSVGTVAISPVAIFDPVFLSGANISRASLKSVKNMIEIGAYPGATVSLVRSGEVIPYLQRYDYEYDTERSKNAVIDLIPKTCDICGKSTKISEDLTLLECNDSNCIGYLPRQVEKFVKGLDIKHIGPALCTKLVELNLVKELSDILNLREKITPEITKILGPEITKRMLKGIDTMLDKPQAEHKVLGNLGVYNVGEETAKDIIEKVGSIDELLKIENDKLLEKMPLVFPGISAAVCSSFQNKIDILQKMKKYGLKFDKVDKSATVMTVVITGALEGMTRKKFQNILELNGVKMASAVSKNIDYLVTNEISSSSKCKKAKTLGIPIINQQELLNKIGSQ